MIEQPFPHLIIDNFYDTRILREVVDNWPDKNWYDYDNPLEKKSTCNNFDGLDNIFKHVFFNLNSHDFMDHIKKLTNCKRQLFADLSLYGAGLHMTHKGGFLATHLDSQQHPVSGLYRLLTLIIYCEPAWEPSWGGNLELFDRTGRVLIKSIEPIYNRAVIFESSIKSYHGQTKPLTCPEGQSRKSLNIYYYVKGVAGMTRKRAQFISDDPSLQEFIKQRAI